MQTQILARLEHACEVITGKNIDIFCATNKYDISYLTGINPDEVDGTWLLVGKNKAVLFSAETMISQLKKQCTYPVLIKNMQSIKNIVIDYYDPIKRIGFDNRAAYKVMTELSDLKNSLTGTRELSIVDMDSPILEIRSIKDTQEIENIKKACEILSSGFEFAYSCLQEGISEKELQTELDIFFLRAGCSLAFPTIIAFGKNTAYCHHIPSNATLHKGDCVLIDAGVIWNGYCSDMTRVVFFNSANPILSQIYETVLEAQNHAISLCAPGINVLTLYNAAHNLLQNDKDFTMPHSLGHGLGLYIHEQPSIHKLYMTTLSTNMVITIEPGLYNSEIGGIRIEDTILVTKDGCVPLTKTKKELLII